MFYVAWAIAFLLVVAYGMAVLGLRAIYFERRTRALRAEVGSYFDERIIVENRSWIPKLWLEIEDQGQHPEHTASFVVSLGPYGRFVRPVHTLCRQRGVFQLGPVFAESGRSVRAVSPASPDRRQQARWSSIRWRCRWRRSGGWTAS